MYVGGNNIVSRVKILFRPFGFIAPKTLNYLAVQSFSILSVPDGGYSSNAPCALHFYYNF
jgi:hypothetical protein